jgi:antitoxin ParD1/3/4
MGLENISLSPIDEALITRLIEQGEFKSSQEVIHAALRLLEHEQKQLAELRAMIDEGDADIAAGRYKTYAPGELAAEIKAMRGLPLRRKPTNVQ